ncbi:hypothetical protein LXL04_025623 [Taraxacum kok-saghyz]
MGCFFACFRVRDDRRPPIHLLSQPIASNPKDRVDSGARNHLSSLLLFEAEDRDQSPCKNRKCDIPGSASPEFNSKELKAEAKFLKACGTLPQTPVEIRNNEKLKKSSPQKEDSEPTTYHSWLQSTSTETLKLEKQSNQQPSPVKLSEEWDNNSNSSSHSPDSCVAGHANQAQSHTPTPLNKFSEIDASSFSFSSSSSEVTSQYNVSKRSPYPTPLSLPNDMQTPGTVFHPSHHNKEIRKNPRIRSQYMIPTLSPVQNANQLKKLAEESFDSSDDCSENYKENSQSEIEKGENELNIDTSLSSWLPPKQNQQGRIIPKFGKTPGDRPILGTVAAHWNADAAAAAASFPPKWWDGNGIPNSTHKYNEDQKVSWHATPFEERLEKALSEDKLTAERKQLGKVPLGELDEKDECESTGRTLQTSSRFESGYVLINSS